MGNLFDFLLVATVIVSVVICFKLGIFGLISPFRKLAAFVCAWSMKDSGFMQRTVGGFIKADKFKAFLNGRIEALWGEKIKQAAEADGVLISERFDKVFGFAGKLFSDLKNFCVSLYEKIFVTDVSLSAATVSEKAEMLVKDAVDYITDAAAGFFTTLLSFIILYIVFSVSFRLGAKLLNSIFSEGLLGLLNRTLGGLVGLFYGVMIAWILSIVFVMIIPLVTPIDLSKAIGGFFGVTEWFYTKFFMSQIFGMAL